MHRERGILLDEYDYLIDSKPVCASILDTVLTLMHCGIKQQEKGDYIFFYLPKLENSNEAKFWRDFFDEAVKIIHGLDGDKIKAIMLVESLPFALDMENCLKSLGKYAAGSTPNFTFNPLESIQAMTAFIVQISLGEAPHGSLEYTTIFAVGLLLFFMTLSLNILGKWLVNKYSENY